jgi:hypothetical protein
MHLKPKSPDTWGRLWLRCCISASALLAIGQFIGIQGGGIRALSFVSGGITVLSVSLSSWQDRVLMAVGLSVGLAALAAGLLPYY